MPTLEQTGQKEWYPAVREVILFVAVVLAVIAGFSLISGDRVRVGTVSPPTSVSVPLPAATVAPRPAAAGWLRAGTVGCDSFFQVDEYWQSVHHNDARQQQDLFTHGCAVLRSLEYSVIDDRGLYPLARLYLEDGRTITVWSAGPLP